MNVQMIQEGVTPLDAASLKVLYSLWQQGFVLTVENGELCVSPEAGLTDQHRAQISQHGEGLSKILRAMEADADHLRACFQDHARLLEEGVGLSRLEAEREAAKAAATYARLKGYPWLTLRMALAPYPRLLAALPSRVGAVDDLPLFLSAEELRNAGDRLLETLRVACDGVKEITAEEMARDLTAIEWREILAGLMSVPTLRAYAKVFARQQRQELNEPDPLRVIHPECRTIQ